MSYRQKRAYEKAKKIFEYLLNGSYIQAKDEDKIRGMVQIIIEER